jgi:hypothetical protein
MMFPDCTDAGVSLNRLDPEADTASGDSGPSFPPLIPPPGLPGGVLGVPVVSVVPLRVIVQVIVGVILIQS